MMGGWGRFEITRRNVIAIAAILSSQIAFSKSSIAQIDGNVDNGPDGGVDGGICFLRGTNILTLDGERAIEELSQGDLVVTSSGEALPIKWIGRRTHYRKASEIWPEGVLPVRIAQDALSDNVPHRDLFVSPAHCLHMDGVLVPAGHLLNGTSISRSCAASFTIEYFHIKLERHSVIFAEGAPAETLLGSHAEYWDNNEARREARYEELPFAPISEYPGNRARLAGHLRSAISPIVDVRRPLDVTRDRLDARAVGHSW